jgi:hypothetical protein
MDNQKTYISFGCGCIAFVAGRDEQNLFIYRAVIKCPSHSWEISEGEVHSSVNPWGKGITRLSKTEVALLKMRNSNG